MIQLYFVKLIVPSCHFFAPLQIKVYPDQTGLEELSDQGILYLLNKHVKYSFLIKSELFLHIHKGKQFVLWSRISKKVGPDQTAPAGSGFTFLQKGCH